MQRLVCRSVSFRPSLRFFSSDNAPKGPSPQTSAWERGAVAVKNTDVENPYLEAIRATHDPALHIKTIEDELKGTIGKALGKQGEKLLSCLREMQQHYKDYQETTGEAVSREYATNYNDARKRAIQARWELLVHRQAVGFIVNNHKYVYEAYPIADAIPLDGMPAEKKPKEKKFTNQLDWWQRVGRWR